MAPRKPRYQFQQQSSSAYRSQKTRADAPNVYPGSIRRPPGPRPWPFMFTMGLISMILPSIGVSSLYLQHNRLPLIWTSMISALSLALYSDDKEQALTGGRRVKENWLLIVDLLGGWPGGFVGQWWCRHKVRKTSYQFCYWVVVLLHNLVWASVLWRMLHGAYINIVSQSQKRG